MNDTPWESRDWTGIACNHSDKRSAKKLERPRRWHGSGFIVVINEGMEKKMETIGTIVMIQGSYRDCRLYP